MTIRLLAEIVAGLQVPYSVGVPLGTAAKPWSKLYTSLKLGGWADIDKVEAALREEITERTDPV